MRIREMIHQERHPKAILYAQVQKACNDLIRSKKFRFLYKEISQLLTNSIRLLSQHFQEWKQNDGVISLKFRLCLIHQYHRYIYSGFRIEAFKGVFSSMFYQVGNCHQAMLFRQK